MNFKRAILVILDSVGVGALPDYKKFGDRATYNTLGNTAKKCKGLKLPNLEKMGIGNLTKAQGIKTQKPTNGFAGKLLEKSAGKDTSTGHWEIAGLYTKKAFPTYSKGFPKEMINRFIKENKLPGILCNKPASGTQIIASLGEESVISGKPIVYTSADSVFQIAVHETYFGLEKLYQICESARKLCDEYGIARVIARPFLGSSNNDFARTPNRKDYSITIPGRLIFDHLAEQNIKTHTVGKVSNIFNHQSIASNITSKNNDAGVDALLKLMKKESEGVLMVNLVDFDMLYGHRRDPQGYGDSLEAFDKRLPEIIQEIGDNDLLIITADHGNDPTAKGTDHTREYVPFLGYSPRIKNSKLLPIGKSFADIGSTIVAALTGKKYKNGNSVLKQMDLEDIQDESTISAYKIIEKKKFKGKLSKQEIHWFINRLMDGTIKDYQMSALLMAIFINGMDVEETANLTDAMLFSGKSLTFDRLDVIDKHSTGGVGDKTSFILAPIAAAAGVKVPMVAGRGLGHTGGTVDKIECIPGFDTDLGLSDLKKMVLDDGIAMIGPTAEIAPADKVIYGLRDVTATIDSIPLITASIMSKKLAEGTSGLVIDLKCGNGAFMKTRKDAKALANSLMNTAARFNKNSTAFITDMSQPLGNAIGNSLEIIESIETLQGKGPKDLTDLSIELAGSMIHLAGICKSHSAGVKRAKEMVKSGKALKAFKDLIAKQNGDASYVDDFSKFPMAKCKYEVKARTASYLKGFKTSDLGLLCVELGGGRKVASDIIDFGVGFILNKKVGDKISKDETILTIYHNPDQEQLVKTIEEQLLTDVLSFTKQKIKKQPLIFEKLIKWS